MSKRLVVLNNNLQFIYNGVSLFEISEDLRNRGIKSSVAFIAEPSKGYVIVKDEDKGAFEVLKDDECDLFETDEQAIEQAIKDGIKIIPENEQHNIYHMCYSGWIDTAANRETLRFYNEEFNMNCYESVY